MSNLVEILVTAKNLTGPAMASVNAEVNKAGKGMAIFHKTALVAAAGVAAIGVESVKMASRFDSDMTLLQTQAGVSADKIGGLKKGVLSLAGKVGQDPDSLAEALYHVESNFESMGISSKKALDLTATAAKGATVGHAGLVDVTNALTAAVAANIPGVSDLNQAMGVLNATVGVGDMKMSDLAKAFGTGMIATVKGFGLSITDVGAALAVFGDNNIRGSLAGNQLRMSVMALAKPVQGGADALKQIGLQTDTLARDMQKGGLKLALEDLVQHMQAAGISSKQQGQIITDAFGRKAGAGLNILVGQMDRLESKYPALEDGAKGFGKSWADTQKTFAFQMKQLQTSFDALMISVGEKLIPPVQAFVHLLAAHRTATVDATIALGGLAATTIAVSLAMKAVAAAKLMQSGFTFLIRQAALLEGSFIAAGGGAKGLAAAFGTLNAGAKLAIAVTAIAGLALAAKHFSDAGKGAKVSADEMTNGLKGLAAGKSAGDLVAQLTKDSDNLHQSLMKRLSSNDSVWDIITNSGKKASVAKKDYKELGSTLSDMVKGGDATQAAAALKKLQDAGVNVPTKYLKDYNNAIAGTKIDSELTAQAQGKFGAQAQKVQAALKAQQDVADGLNQSLQALDQTNQSAYNSETAFWGAISKASDALKQNGRTLDVHSEKGQANRDTLSAIAAATDDYTSKLTAQGATWDTVDAAYKRGYDALVKAAQGFGDNRKQAEALANSLLHLPKEVVVKGNTSDLESKLSQAKAHLASLPKSKTTKGSFDYRQALADVAFYQRAIDMLHGKTVTVRINNVSTQVNAGQYYSQGPHKAKGGPIVGPGTGTSDDVLMWGSNGEYVVNAEATRKNLPLLEAINSGKHGIAAFAKGGKVSKAQQAAAAQRQAEQQARNEAMGWLSISYFGQAAGYRQNPFENQTGAPASVGDLVGSLNDWASKIKAATHGAEESKLLKAFDRFGVVAIKNEKSLLSVNNALASAKDKLASLKDSFAQLRDSVASSVTAYGSIAKQNTGQPGGAKSVIAGLQTDVQTAQRFASDLAALKKKGLNAQSLSELAQAGIEGGGLENAERLLGASGGDIKTINALEKQLQAAGKAAGTATADAMYGAGIKQAQGLVTGLEKQQKRIEAVMERAADAMAAQLKRALGVKAKGAGGVVGAAATGGARWGRTLVGEYGPELADLPAGTMVHSAPDTARMLAGGGGRPIVIHTTIQLDGRVVAEQLLEPTRQLVQQHGGDVQATYGRRTR